MHSIITAELFSQDLKIQECGMLWGAAMTRWEKEMRLTDAMEEHRTARIGRVSQFIKWENFIMQWVLPTNRRQFMHSN